MIKNYLKSTLRNLWKTRTYSFLNIFGLAIGIAAASLIFLWIEDEAGYDDFPNKENIYQVKSKQNIDGTVRVGDDVQGLLGPAIKADIPGIQYATRVNWGTSCLMGIGDNNIHQNGHLVDPDFINIFSLEFLEGNKATALARPDNIVITESAAHRIFGDAPALGKTVRVNNNENYIISGVVKDLPKNSSVQFDWLRSFEEFERKNDWLRDWKNDVVMTYVQLAPAASLANVNKVLYDFAKIKSGNAEVITRNLLYPMERWRLYNNFDKDGNEQPGRMKYISLFSIIAWVVLLIACINFMNLATARSEKRAKEVGIRKVVGASKTSLIARFLGESVILATLSALLAIAFTTLSIGIFNSLVEKQLVVDLLNPIHLIFLVSIVLACGLLSGSYPAFYLSSFNPLSTLKGAKQKAGAAGFVRRGLVVMQYAASITLIVCTIIIFQQIQHAKGRDLGFERSQVLILPLQGKMNTHMEAIKEQLIATGSVDNIGLSSGSVLDVGVSTWSMDWPGKAPDKQTTVFYLWADEGFISTMGMELLDGRTFKPRMLGDSTSIIINEAFAKPIRPDGKVAGQKVYWDKEPFTVVGVIKDYVYNNVYSPAGPVFFRPFTLNGGSMNIKLKAGTDFPKALAKIEQVIKTNNPGYPFEYQFLDDQFNNKFNSEMLIQKLAAIFAVMSIIISCFGLFGLAAFTAERRTKEMGIRKVLGASISSLVGLLNREFVVLVLVSCAVAFPIAWWMMSNWLDNYQYHTNMHWWIFALAGGGALTIALLTVSSHAIKAALVSPTKNLQAE
jgi:putative ABC transport system permease protein